MKVRALPIRAAVEMNPKAVGLTVVVRPSRMAVNAAGRTGHSSSRPSTLIQAVMSSIARTSAAARAPRRAGAALLHERSPQRSQPAPDVAIDAIDVGQRRDELFHREQAHILTPPESGAAGERARGDGRRGGRDRVVNRTSCTTVNAHRRATQPFIDPRLLQIAQIARFDA
jgi:hypothetical protein